MRLPGTALGILFLCSIGRCICRRVTVNPEDLESNGTDRPEAKRAADMISHAQIPSRNLSERPTVQFAVPHKRRSLPTVVQTASRTHLAEIQLNRTSRMVPATAVTKTSSRILHKDQQAPLKDVSPAERSELQGSHQVGFNPHLGSSTMIELHRMVVKPGPILILVPSLCFLCLCLCFWEGHLRDQDSRRSSARQSSSERAMRISLSADRSSHQPRSSAEAEDGRVKKFIAKGKEKRGADGEEHYKFGDITRGIIASCKEGKRSQQRFHDDAIHPPRNSH